MAGSAGGLVGGFFGGGVGVVGGFLLAAWAMRARLRCCSMVRRAWVGLWERMAR